MKRVELGMGYCGLVCALCSENENCLGCKAGGCGNTSTCKNYQCCKEKEIASCSVCDEFPCTGTMLDNVRIRTFCKLRKNIGEQTLLQYLYRNEEAGIHYHEGNQIVGAYDALDEQGIIDHILGLDKREG